jgi:hypothetical protein
MARRTVPLIGPIVPVKGNAPPGRKVLVPANAAAGRARGGAGGPGKRVVPVPDADEPTAAVVVRTRRPAPPMPPPAGRKQAPAPPPASRRAAAMKALRAGKVAF